MTPALRLLLRQRFSAAQRAQLRRLRTWGGAATAVFVVGLLVVAITARWVGFSPLSLVDPERLRASVALGLAAMWLANLLAGRGNESFIFLPAERDVLFAAPLRPADIVRYKLAYVGLATVMGGAMLSPLMVAYARDAVGGLLVAPLVFPFLQLSAMLLALVLARRKPLPPATRLAGVGLAVVALVVAQRTGVLPRLLDEAGTVLDHPTGRLLLAPFIATATLTTSPFAGEIARAAGVLAACDVALALGITALAGRLDLEAAADAAGSLHDQMRTVRTGGIGALGGWHHRHIPRLPWLGGVGPIAWRRTAELLRRPGIVGSIAAFLVLGIAAAQATPLPGRDPSARTLQMLMQAQLVLGVVLPSILRLDFRSDLDRMQELLILPVRPFALVVGQILPAAAVLTLAEWASCALCVAVDVGVARHAATIAALGPFWLLALLAVQNAVFLWFPTRMEAGVPDVQSAGRQMIAVWVDMALAGALAAVGLTCVLVSTYTLGTSLPGVVLAAVALLAVALLGALGAVGRLTRYDAAGFLAD